MMVGYLVAYDIGGHPEYFRHLVNLFLSKRFTAQMRFQQCCWSEKFGGKGAITLLAF